MFSSRSASGPVVPTRETGNAANSMMIFKFKYHIFVLIILIMLLGISSAIGVPQSVEEVAAGSNHNAAVWLIAYIFLALGFSFLCSIAEAVLLSVTPSYIESQRAKRPKFAILMKRLKQDNIDRSLAAILTLNTIAHTVGAIGAGAQATILFGSTWFGLFSAIMTLMILFLSEIIPKTLGAIYWSKLARLTALFVSALIFVLYPIVWISEKLTKIISRHKTMHIFSRDEFIAMANLGEQTGHIPNKESSIIRNLFRLNSLNVTDIMTPRTVAFALPENATVRDAMKQISQNPFSRILIYRTDIDHITGFVLKDEILLSETQERSEELLKSLKREIITIPDTVSVSTLLERFLRERQHIAIVVDEHGGTKGLVTLEDVIETLMGVEIIDEMDKTEDMRILARKLWKDRAKALGIDTNTGQSD